MSVGFTQPQTCFWWRLFTEYQGRPASSRLHGSQQKSTTSKKSSFRPEDFCNPFNSIGVLWRLSIFAVLWWFYLWIDFEVASPIHSKAKFSEFVNWKVWGGRFLSSDSRVLTKGRVNGTKGYGNSRDSNSKRVFWSIERSTCSHTQGVGFFDSTRKNLDPRISGSNLVGIDRDKRTVNVMSSSSRLLNYSPQMPPLDLNQPAR